MFLWARLGEARLGEVSEGALEENAPVIKDNY